jgi:transposase
MMGAKARLFTPLPAVTLEELVPADHFYRQLDRVFDLAFVRDLAYSCSVADKGRPSVDPVVFFRLQLVMFFEGIRSERQLLRLAADRLSVRWYLGYNLDEALPDHSTLTRTRLRYGLEIFRRFFEAVVEQCQQAGLVWGQELSFDATQVQADASLDSLTARFAVEARQARQPHHERERQQEAQQTTEGRQSGRDDEVQGEEQEAVRGPQQAVAARLAALFRQDDMAADTLPAPTPPTAPTEPMAPTPLPLTLSDALRAELEAANAGRHDWIAEEGRQQRAVRGVYQRTADLRISTTDPDATPMRLKGGETHLGYQTHYVVDGGRKRIIVGVLVAPGEVMENEPMLDLLWRVRFRWKLQVRQVTGDTKYGTMPNIRAVEDMGIHAYVPLPDWEQKSPYFGASKFSYDAEHDLYVCPNGQALRRTHTSDAGQRIQYRALASTCRACPLRTHCTPGRKSGRSVWRSFGEEYLERVRSYQSTSAYKKALRKRKVWVEPLFAEAKEWHGLRRFRLRRLWRVNSEALLTAAGQNLKRLLAQHGWGRRPLPSGAALALTQLDVVVWMSSLSASSRNSSASRGHNTSAGALPDTNQTYIAA